MNEIINWIGIDVGERTSVVCFLDSNDGLTRRSVEGAGTSQIVEALETVDRASIAAIAIESSAGHRLTRELAALGFPVFSVDAARAKKFLSIRVVKSDGNDAAGLAEIARHGSSSRLGVHVKNVTSEQIRVQLSLRDQMVRQKGAVRSSLRDHLRTLSSDVLRLPPPTKLRSFIEQEMRGLRDRGLGAIVPDIMALLDITEALTRCVDRLDKRVEQIAKSLPATQRLLAIPGVGPIAALSFYSAIEDPHRFARSADVGAYLGLTPSIKQSGSILRRGRITKAGNKLTRSHLVMAAGVILGRAATKTALGDWAADLRGRIGWGKARVALARKLAVVMLTIWRSNDQFRPYPE